MSDSEYTQRGKEERDALNGLFSELLKENEKFRYTVYHTPGQTKSRYDCLVRQYCKQTGKVLKKMFFEAKIRGAHYETLLIERQKLDSMKKLIRDLDVDKLYYVNFTPISTIIFDLLKIESEGKISFVKHNHNKTTVEKELGKVEKEVAYISVNEGKVFAYVYTKETKGTPLIEENEPEPEPEPETTVLPAVIEPELVVAEVVEQPKYGVVDEKSLYFLDSSNIRRDENGQILYDSFDEFQSFPLKIQWLCVAQQRIKRWLRPGEDRLTMIELMGGEIELGKFLHKRVVDDLFKRQANTQFHLTKDDNDSINDFFNNDDIFGI